MKPTLIFLFVVICSVCFSQVVSVDLASIEPDKEKTITFKGVRFDKVKVLNKFLGKKYTVTVKEVTKPIPALDLGEAMSSSDSCKTAQELLENLKVYAEEGDSEEELKKKLDAVETILQDAKNCPNYAKLLQDFEEIKAVTIETVLLGETFEIKPGKDILIIVQRDDKTWTFRIEGDPIGLWIITYGYGLTSLQGQKEYFAKSVTDSTYSIRAKRRNESLDLEYTPAIFFSFLPYQRSNSVFYYSLSGGLGFDAENPALFFGPSLFFRQNLGLSAGIAFKKLARLNPKYNPDEIIEENLAFDQLHDKTYRPLFFVSLNFRFKENPFKKKGEDKEEE